MFIPIYDVNALKHIRLQYVTIAIILANVLMWVFTGLAADEFTAARTSMGLGFVPALFFRGAQLDPQLVMVGENLTFITYAFVHAGFLHLASNMIFLWVFGDNVEDAMGHIRFILFYLLCAAAAAAFHGLLMQESTGPLIGASGAISGVVASYFLLHPRVRIWVLVLLRIPLPLPAFIPLLLWIGQQFYMLVAEPGGHVSWAAHAGGILAGLVLTPLLKRRGVPLFDRVLVTPKAVEHKEEVVVAEPPKTQTMHWGR